MLIDILREIAKSNTHSYASLAQSLNMERDTVKHMFTDLLRMGYVISDEPACGDGACDACSICCTKSKEKQIEKPTLEIRRWRLTEKGKAAAEVK